MDLWIRSQDKRTLIKAEFMEVEQITDDEVSFNVNGYSLAAYKTKERAVAVLDEIQKYLDEKPIIRYSPYGVGNNHYMNCLKDLSEAGHIMMEDGMNIVPVNTRIYQLPEV